MTNPSDRDRRFMARHPVVFRNIDFDPQRSLMVWGLNVGDGWLPPLDQLVRDLAVVIQRDGLHDFEIAQVKEKLGELRVYVRGANDQALALIDAAEARSIEICAVCSQHGQRRSEAWVWTLCDRCHAEARP
ncbi:MAG: hypothetical protein Q4F71_00520 [Paracoccus sp. (in: a-proteobacteria)]|nr:hypothetical protein [Paracoccus sp. (in: a-proteobacteria)]